MLIKDKMKLNFVFVAVLLCWVTQDFELYAAFDPLADKVYFLFVSDILISF